jgi:hypothetical protein
MASIYFKFRIIGDNIVAFWLMVFGILTLMCIVNLPNNDLLHEIVPVGEIGLAISGATLLLASLVPTVNWFHRLNLLADGKRSDP